MQPTNKVERRNAFINFLLLFIVIIALFTTIVFFSIEVPLAENKKLREEISQLEKEKEVAKTLQKGIEEIKGDLTDPVFLKNPPEVVNRRIQNKIQSMDTLISQLPSPSSSIYPSVTEILSYWKASIVNSQVKQSEEPSKMAGIQ